MAPLVGVHTVHQPLTSVRPMTRLLAKLKAANGALILPELAAGAILPVAVQ